jgi:hypothetical protein
MENDKQLPPIRSLRRIITNETSMHAKFFQTPGDAIIQHKIAMEELISVFDLFTYQMSVDAWYVRNHGTGEWLKVDPDSVDLARNAGCTMQKRTDVIKACCPSNDLVDDELCNIVAATNRAEWEADAN